MGGIPNVVNPNPVGIIPPGMYGFEARNLAGPARSYPYPVSASSTRILIGDPVTITSGVVSRGTAASTTLFGLAGMPSIRSEIRQIPTMPFETQPVSGLNMIGVYAGSLASGNEYFGQVAFGQTLAQSMINATYDIGPTVAAGTPTLTTAGTAGATTRYYSAIPVTAAGEAIGVNGTALTTSNATNSTTNYNIITIPYVAGAAYFNIYRGTSNSNGTLIAQVGQTATVTGQTTVVNDTGLASYGASYVVSTVDNCGWVVNTAASSTNVLTIRALVDPAGTVSSPTQQARVVFVITAAANNFV